MPEGGRSRVSRRDTERMQNELKASTAGRIGKVAVLEGATVETGAMLITVVEPEE